LSLSICLCFSRPSDFSFLLLLVIFQISIRQNDIVSLLKSFAVDNEVKFSLVPLGNCLIMCVSIFFVLWGERGRELEKDG
jgi:hypothetical protein